MAAAAFYLFGVLHVIQLVLLFFVQSSESQSVLLVNRTDLDTNFLQPILELRKLLHRTETRDGELSEIYSYNKRKGKLQPRVPITQNFFCDAKHGPGRRSAIPPQSVHQLRPGDIDIIAAIGDSLTAANGALSSRLIHMFIENRAIAWAMGGRANWRKYLTLPNILREFNPNLYGYSVEDGLTVERGSKFNVAEPMTLYDDMLFQTKLLIKRMKHDPNVDMQSHWKLITIFLGNNDICSKICEVGDPRSLLDNHEEHVVSALRFLRDNVPRVIVNWVPLPNLVHLHSFKGTPMECFIAQRIECRCIYSEKVTKEKLAVYSDVVEIMQRMQMDIVNRDEFDTETFTINFQPLTMNITFPTRGNGYVDLRFYAQDCFHFSQLGHATAANAIWNNMLQPNGRKQVDWYPVFEKFECPTNNMPFFITRRNS